MASIVFSQAPRRRPNTLNWPAPIQAAFAFFAPACVVSQSWPKAVKGQLQEVRPSVYAKVQSQRRMNFSSDQSALIFEPLLKPDDGAKRVNQLSGLKVLREFEPGKSRSSTGRLVISGRMADVCAALERMDTQSASTL